MRNWLAMLVVVCGMAACSVSSAEVLIVADEFPAMEVLAAKLKAEENITSKLVWQTNLPAGLSAFQAVLVYIHRDLNEPAEQAMIKYTREGGRLVALHHSISSGKRKNKEWFQFLGVDLPQKDVDAGGYKWIEGVTLDLVNLAPEHFITTHKVQYPQQIAWTAGGVNAGEKTVPGVTLQQTEVYLNHLLTEPRKRLFGFKYTDAKSGKTYEQTHAGWVKPAGKGWIVYLMPGHSALDFQNAVYGRVVVNAVVWKP